MAAAVVLVAVVTALQPAAIGGTQEKEETQIQVFKRVKRPTQAKPAEQRGPRLRAEDAIRVFQAQSQAKRDEAIRTLKEIIRSTSPDDPQLPEYLFRLSEQYWSKAHFYNLRAYGYDDEIWATEKTDPGRCEQLKRLKQEDLRRSEQYRDKAIEVYKQIIRRFPSYSKLDHVLFYLGFNYKEKGDREAAQKIFTLLIKKYPRSKFIPDTLFSFGEFFFDIDQVEPALRFYEKASKYKDSPVYGFALYKMGWCYYNLGDYKAAIKKFVQVIRYSESERAKHDRNRITLLREAQNDLVRTYSNFGSAGKAIAFFKKIVPKNYRLLAKKLAALYAAEGKTSDSNKLYRKLIKLDPSNPEIVEFQLAIATNTEKEGDKRKTSKEVKYLVELYRKFHDEGKLDPKKDKEIREQIQDLLRDLATTWHREAQVTKNDTYLQDAQVMYEEYIKTFPKAKDIYLMTFYYAELLYKIRKWAKAAHYYEQVIELDPKGKFAREAAHATVLAYQKLLKMGEKRETRGTPVGSQGGQETPKPKEIPPDQMRFIEACDRYVKMVPDGERIVDVKYYAALTFYDYNHFKEAIRRFEDIIAHHPTHRLAIYAANLALDSYNLAGDYKGLDKAVERYLANKQIARGDLLETLMTLREGAAFKACLQLEKEKKYKEAAKAFIKFVAQFKTSEFYDKALYNAALNFERVNDIANAIKARLRLIRERPSSPLVPKALFAIAGNFHASAVYSQAAKTYEVYADRYPRTKEAEVALANAAVFRHGLGDYAKAIENYRKWLERYGKKHPKKGSAVALTISQIYMDQGNHAKAIRELLGFFRSWARHASDDDVIVAHTRMGLAYKALGKRKKAMKAFEKAVTTFKGLPAARRKALVDGREAAAHARYEQGEILYQAFEAVKINSAKKLKKQVLEKVKRMAKAQEVYVSVIDYGHPNWTIAAMERIGRGWQDLADAIRKSPPPKGLNEEELLVYQDELDQKAMQFEEQAIKFYTRCMELAAKYKWFNTHTVHAEKSLAKLDPQKFQPISEIRTRPLHLGEEFHSSGFATEVK